MQQENDNPVIDTTRPRRSKRRNPLAGTVAFYSVVLFLVLFGLGAATGYYFRAAAFATIVVVFALSCLITKGAAWTGMIVALVVGVCLGAVVGATYGGLEGGFTLAGASIMPLLVYGGLSGAFGSVMLRVAARRGMSKLASSVVGALSGCLFGVTVAVIFAYWLHSLGVSLQGTNAEIPPRVVLVTWAAGSVTGHPPSKWAGWK